VAHNVGPYTHPSLAFAKRIWLTEADDGDEADANGSGGASAAAQVLLPFAVVTTMAGHGPVVQGEVPRTKPCDAEIKLTDPGSKCAGTGAAAASAPVAKDAVPPKKSSVQAILLVPMVEQRA
jgi:hypothetical protein